jgi:hypothetical protein
MAGNTSGSGNSAFGDLSLDGNTLGASNSAFGASALTVTATGSNNSAFGAGALRDLASGDDNVGIGDSAGLALTSGSDNVYIGNNTGAGTESGQLRIGEEGVQTDAFIAGIEGNVVTGSAVLVSSSGELGVAASSLRFKQDVRDMGSASNVLSKLRPVTFKYRPEVGGAGDIPTHGLLAEEVAVVAPELVDFDDEGKPFSVHYHLLAPMLLNEVQEQQRTIEGQRQEIAALASRLERLERQRAAGPEGAQP